MNLNSSFGALHNVENVENFCKFLFNSTIANQESQMRFNDEQSGEFTSQLKNLFIKHFGFDPDEVQYKHEYADLDLDKKIEVSIKNISDIPVYLSVNSIGGTLFISYIKTFEDSVKKANNLMMLDKNAILTITYAGSHDQFHDEERNG